MALEMTDADIFGPLKNLIQCETVTDLNYNGKDLWIDDLKKGRYMAQDVTLSDAFLNRLSMHLSNQMNLNFNRYHPVLEAETPQLRISIIHESVTDTGRSLSIRKTPAVKRIREDDLEKSEYCHADLIPFMKNCVRAGFTIMIAGLPGAGKTEYLKYLTGFIPREQKVITVEDNLEIHYCAINPGKDGIELKVGEQFSYAQAIKASMRQLPGWLILSEARSKEVVYLLEAMSTGVSCMTTIHTDDVRKIPDRICSMARENVMDDVYTFLDIGILIGCYHVEGEGIRRRIEQAALFERNDAENKMTVFFEDGKFRKPELSETMKRKFGFAGITDPFAKEIQGV